VTMPVPVLAAALVAFSLALATGPRGEAYAIWRRVERRRAAHNRLIERVSLEGARRPAG